MSEGTAGRGGPPAAAAAVRTVEEEPPPPPTGDEPADSGPAATSESDPAATGSEPAGAVDEADTADETDTAGAVDGTDAADETDTAGAANGTDAADADGPSDGGEHPSGRNGRDAGAPPPMGNFRTALVSGISVDLPNQHPTVVLRESETPRRQLSFSVSLQDGVVLSHALRRIPTPRPLTHELLSEVLKGFEIDVVAVRLVGRRGAVYFAELDLRGRRGRSVHSCRPSDALAVALVQSVPVPILIDNRLFEEAGDVTPASSAASPA